MCEYPDEKKVKLLWYVVILFVYLVIYLFVYLVIYLVTTAHTDKMQ